MVSSTTGGSDNPIAIGFLGHETIATAIGLMLFIAAIAYIYKRSWKSLKKTAIFKVVKSKILFVA